MRGELIVEERGPVRRLTLNRVEHRNALTPELIEMLAAELERVGADPEARVLVLAGAGGTFCAGYDLNLLESPGRPDAGSERDRVEGLCARLRAVRIPTVARVDGVASGAGCDLAVSCDVRIASSDARFAMPPARLGILYSPEGIARLAALVGPAVAKELLFTGELVDAERALAIGLANRVVPPERLEAETDAFAERVAANAPLSVAASKRIVDGAAPEEAAELGRLVWMSEDAREGPAAFRERRPPRFRGR
jgi:enoyl-CoA hydratase/carnithine racemase